MTSRRVLLVVLAASLTICKSPTAPASAAVSPPSTAGRHIVTVPAEGVTLGGILFRPAAAGARPAIVVLHGWQPAGTNGAAVVEARARQYAEAGYVALALSLRGWPPSGGTDDCGLKQPDDLVAAVAWLRALPGVDPHRVALVGFSQGGQVALLAAARGAAVRAVVAYFPVTDVARWKSTTTTPTSRGTSLRCVSREG